MLEQRVFICDECKSRIAAHKCDFCNNDMCDFCALTLQSITLNTNVFGKILVCKKCRTIFAKIRRNQQEFYDEDFKKKIVDDVKQYLKGRMLAEKL